MPSCIPGRYCVVQVWPFCCSVGLTVSEGREKTHERPPFVRSRGAAMESSRFEKGRRTAGVARNGLRFYPDQDFRRRIAGTSEPSRVARLSVFELIPAERQMPAVRNGLRFSRSPLFRRQRVSLPNYPAVAELLQESRGSVKGEVGCCVPSGYRIHAQPASRGRNPADWPSRLGLLTWRADGRECIGKR